MFVLSDKIRLIPVTVPSFKILFPCYTIEQIVPLFPQFCTVVDTINSRNAVWSWNFSSVVTDLGGWFLPGLNDSVLSVFPSSWTCIVLCAASSYMNNIDQVVTLSSSCEGYHIFCNLSWVSTHSISLWCYCWVVEGSLPEKLRLRIMCCWVLFLQTAGHSLWLEIF